MNLFLRMHGEVGMAHVTRTVPVEVKLLIQNHQAKAIVLSTIPPIVVVVGVETTVLQEKYMRVVGDHMVVALGVL
jgi:hypothetical protein